MEVDTRSVVSTKDFIVNIINMVTVCLSLSFKLN